MPSIMIKGIVTVIVLVSGQPHGDPTIFRHHNTFTSMDECWTVMAKDLSGLAAVIEEILGAPVGKGFVMKPECLIDGDAA